MSNDRFNSITQSLIERFQIRLNSDFRKEKDGLKLILKPYDLPVAEGFQISILVGWKRISIEFLPGEKAGLLLIAMGQANVEKKAVFRSIVENVQIQKGTISLVVNGNPIDLDESNLWPDYWQNVNFKLKSPVIDTDEDLSLDEHLDEHILKWTGIYLSMLMPLLPLEEIQKNYGGEKGNNIECLPEGAQIKVIVNRYERSQINRQACISIYGTKCQICNFDFRKKYGPEGEGYIEVHHITPVSQLGDGYLVNPVKDLIPLCSNCHAMIHRRNPPYSVEEIKHFIIANN